MESRLAAFIMSLFISCLSLSLLRSAIRAILWGNVSKTRYRKIMKGRSFINIIKMDHFDEYIKKYKADYKKLQKAHLFCLYGLLSYFPYFVFCIICNNFILVVIIATIYLLIFAIPIFIFTIINSRSVPNKGGRPWKYEIKKK